LLAQKILRGATCGYKHHPQLLRFAGQKNPPAALAAYLKAVHDEALERDYEFDAKKIGRRKSRGKNKETAANCFTNGALEAEIEKARPEASARSCSGELPPPRRIRSSKSFPEKCGFGIR
jgi:hypothetical protein